MADARPSSHPQGYWLSGTGATLPGHVWPQWMLDLYGPQLPLNALSLPELKPEGNPSSGPSRSPYTTDFAQLHNALTRGRR